MIQTRAVARTALRRDLDKKRGVPRVHVASEAEPDSHSPSQFCTWTQRIMALPGYATRDRVDRFDHKLIRRFTIFQPRGLLTQCLP